jgi:galactoside O-acetyltransferase
MYMQLTDRICFAFDAVLARWPEAVGGQRLRLTFWKHRFAYCGNAIFFGDQLVISNFSTIRIGTGTSIMGGSCLYANEGILEIGSHCSFNHNVFLGASGGEIVIGNDVLIGPNVVLRAADHQFSDPDRPIRLQGHARGKIVIGDNVWLAANVVVTSGVTIGNGCVVGAGSVVTQDLPPMSVCVGNPARPTRSRLTVAAIE